MATNPARLIRRVGEDAGRIVRQFFDDPYRARDALQIRLGLLRGAYLFRHARGGRRLSVLGKVSVIADGDITLGRRIIFAGGMFRSDVVCHRGAEIVIGDDTGFNYGISLEARIRIQIGKRCMFGQMVRICDFERVTAAPIVIGDDVWIAHGAVIGPGVTIGDEAVISAGSVVTTNVPARAIAMGNPARCFASDIARI